MNVVMLFDTYEIFETILGIEFALLAAVALAGVMNLIRLDHDIRKRYAERKELMELFYDTSVKERQRLLEEKETSRAEEEAATP
jgi:hypothetical protein